MTAFILRCIPILLSIVPLILCNEEEKGTTETVLREKVRPQIIIDSLFNASYDRRIRPPHRDSKGKNLPVHITVNTYIRSMSNIDFVRMEYSVQLTFRQEWKDERLAYANAFPGERVPKFLILSNTNQLWIPDTFFLNEKSATKHVVDTPNMMIRVYSDGRILYSERLSLVLSCPMFLQKYPMDQQKCRMDVASYAYTDEDILYEWRSTEPIQFHSMLNGSLPCFTLHNVETGTCTSKTNTGTYSCIRTLFYLQRQFSYYLVQVYIPSSLLVVTSWVSFWLDRTAVPARVTLGVTTLLTMTTQAAAINNALPAVSYVKSVDVWIGICLFFIFSSVLEYAWVSLVASNTENKQRRRKECESTSPRDDKGVWKENEGDNLLSSEEKTEKALIPRLNIHPSFWDKWTHSADKSKMIDLRSRIVFPAAFFLVNILYWTWYSLLE